MTMQVLPTVDGGGCDGQNDILTSIHVQIEEQASAILQQMKAEPRGLVCLAESGIRRILADEIENIMLPTLVLREHAKSRLGTDVRFDSDDYVSGFLERRIATLTRFLHRVNDSICEFFRRKGQDADGLSIISLAGDSHNGAQRPIMFAGSDQRKCVLKYADPRPYQLLAELTEYLSTKTRYRIVYPQVVAAPDNSSYVIPYIDPQERHAAEWGLVTKTAYNYGVVCAVCYILKAIDVHLENVVISGALPIVIDPECILYDFPEMPQRFRLQSTGIVCWDPNQSALRSGNNPMVHFGRTLRSDGVLMLLSPVGPAANRVVAPDERSIDMKEYRDDVVSGFVDGYKAALANRGAISGLIRSFVGRDFRIRYLCRKTRHYRVVQEMLTMPAASESAKTRDYIFETFEKSAGFPRRISRRMIAAERHDLMDGDIPYFWCTSLDSSIRHGGEVVRNGKSTSAEVRTDRILRRLSEEDADRQIAILKDFLVQDDTPGGNRRETVEKYATS